jgi:hypothetical protein
MFHARAGSFVVEIGRFIADIGDKPAPEMFGGRDLGGYHGKSA